MSSPARDGKVVSKDGNRAEDHHEMIDSLSAEDLQKFISNEIFGLEMQVSSSIAQLIVESRKCGNLSGIYMDISNLTYKPGGVEITSQGAARDRTSSP
jgi:hypothetical protein